MQCKLFMDLKRERIFSNGGGGVHLEEGRSRRQGPLYVLVTLLCESFCLLQSNGILQWNQGKPAMLHSLPSHNLHSSHPDVQYLIWCGHWWSNSSQKAAEVYACWQSDWRGGPKTLERHLWYLSDLTIPMALFSEKVDLDPRHQVQAGSKAPCPEEQQQQKQEGRLSETCETQVPQDRSQYVALRPVDRGVRGVLLYYQGGQQLAGAACGQLGGQRGLRKCQDIWESHQDGNWLLQSWPRTRTLVEGLSRGWRITGGPIQTYLQYDFQWFPINKSNFMNVFC